MCIYNVCGERSISQFSYNCEKAILIYIVQSANHIKSETFVFRKYDNWPLI